MKIKITSRKRNPLLKRREVAFEVDHRDIGGTPHRLEVRKEVASMLKTDLELVYVKKMETKRGTMVAVGEANAYDSVEDASLVEPEYIVARNLPPQKPEEKTVEKPKEGVEEATEKLTEKKEEAKKIAEKPHETAEKKEGASD